MQEQVTQPPLPMGVLLDAVEGDDGLRLRERCREKVESGFNFVLMPLARPLPASGLDSLTAADYAALPAAAFTRQAHKALNSAQWNAVVGVVGELPGRNADPELNSAVVNEAVQWASYLGMHGVMLPLDEGGGRDGADIAALLARILHDTQAIGFDIWLRLSCSEKAWRYWNEIRHCIGVVPGRRLHVVLDFSRAATAGVQEALHYQRWFGESVAAILLPTAIFGADVDGNAVMQASVEQQLVHFMQYPGIKWVIEGECLSRSGYSAYRHYLTRLQNRRTPSWEEVYLRSSVDQLQRPLQPLADHLASLSYEEFERDTVKYRQYEKAISQALAERHAPGSAVTIMVLGAGRGPIVDAAVRAARRFQGQVRFFVIEKNPSAVVTLRHRARDDWADADVSIVKTDMRHWQTTERADIIVSELLGSWGDNELSPECLDGAQHLLKPAGISIPAASTSYLAPITTARLHGTIASLIPFGHEELSTRAGFETGYVVRMGAVLQLAEEQSCFSFTHPNEGLRSNERVARCVFELLAQLELCTIHGFRGTFSCQLYGEHSISIADHDRTPGMFSWSPLYLPVITPFTVSGGSRLEVQLWRKVAADKVWYEWLVKDHTPLHNPSGRSSTIGVP